MGWVGEACRSAAAWAQRQGAAAVRPPPPSMEDWSVGSGTIVSTMRYVAGSVFADDEAYGYYLRDDDDEWEVVVRGADTVLREMLDAAVRDGQPVEVRCLSEPSVTSLDGQPIVLERVVGVERRVTHVASAISPDCCGGRGDQDDPLRR